MTSSGDDRAIGVRWPDGDRTDICRSPSDYFPFVHTARSPSDLRAMIARWPGGDRPIFGNIFSRKIGWWPSGHSPMFGRRPGGRRRMAKLPQESADHPANFNCKLNLLDRRWMRAQGVLNWRMAVGFLQDSSPGSRAVVRRSIFPYCDVALKEQYYLTYLSNMRGYFVANDHGSWCSVWMVT